MEFKILFYSDSSGNEPVSAFLDALRQQDRILHKLVVSGITKLKDKQRHGPPLTEKADDKENIFELRVGDANIARVFFFFSERARHHSHQWIREKAPKTR